MHGTQQHAVTRLDHRGRRCGTYAAPLAAALLLLPLLPPTPTTRPAQKPSLRITLPGAGDEVHPGQRLSAVVEVQPTVRLEAVALWGNFPLPKDVGRLSPPWNLTFIVPRGAPEAGRYYVFAVGVLAPGRTIESPRVWLDLEPGRCPERLRTSRSLYFSRIGEYLPLSVTAFFHGAPTMDVTKSTRIRYSTANKSVAVVDSIGRVTSAGFGETEIYVRFYGETAVVPVSVVGARNLGPPGRSVGAPRRTGPSPLVRRSGARA